MGHAFDCLTVEILLLDPYCLLYGDLGAGRRMIRDVLFTLFLLL